MASKLDHDKPLPTIPKRHDTPKLTTLSVEARNHTRRFILRALEEESSTIAGNDWDHDNDAWTNGILDALDSLGDSVAEGGWIAGANRSRRASIQRKLTPTDIEEGTTTTDAVAEPKNIAPPDSPQLPANHSPPKPPASTATEWLSFWASKVLPPSPKPYAKHILLTVAAFGHSPDNASDFEIVPSAVGCIFLPSRFMLPRTAPFSAHAGHEEGVILYGLDEWNANAGHSDGNPIQIVGGSFLLQGVASAAQHVALCNVLRLSIYIYLSVVIEQHLFSDSHVKLNIPKVRPRPAPLPIKFPSNNPETPHAGERPPDRDSHTGVWSFLSKKTGGLLNRATSLARHGSLDIRRTTRDSPRRSVDAPHPRGRRLSFLADGLPWQTKAVKQTEQHAKDHPFRTTVTRIEGFRDLFSTTAGIHFSVPPLLRSIAEKEDSDPTRKLDPDERVQLHYLLGWEGRDAQGKGMVGIRGFVRQQEFCALYSEHVLPIPATRAPSVTSTTSESSATNSSSLTGASAPPAPTPTPALCGGRRRWMRFRYYSREDGADKTLGGMIMRMATTAEDQCGNPGCQSKRYQHELDFIHGGTRVTVNINPLEDVIQEERIDMWQTCVMCWARTKTARMSDGTFLLSFGKFLELLVYSQSFHIITPPLCEHIVPVEDNTNITPWRPGLNIARHFAYRSHLITFTLAVVEEVYNVEVPRVRFVHGAYMSEEVKPAPGSPTMSPRSPNSSESETGDVRRILKREMRSWWHTLSERIDDLERMFGDDTEVVVPSKSLPRIPSSIDPDYEEETESSQATPKVTPSTLPSPSSMIQEPETEADSAERTPRIEKKTLPILPENEPDHETPSHDAISEEPISPPPHPPPERNDSKLSAKSTSSASTRSLPKIPHPEEMLQLLQNLREDFQREEHSLYSTLAKTPNECLNNVRHAFKTSAKGAAKRMSAWEGKHCGKGSAITSPYPDDPPWWMNGNHAIPGSNILINESDWGSMIAFTLSSGDYLAELASMSGGRSMTSEQPQTRQPSIARPSLFSRSSYRLFGPSRQQPDPDDGHAVWEEPEVYSAVVSRKEHPRDPSSILSIRDVLRKAPVDTASILSPSRLANTGLSKTGTPPSAWSKPAVEINTHPADGEVVLPENDGAAGQILQEMEAATDDRGLSRSNTITEATYGTSTSSSSVLESTVRRGKTSSILSTVKKNGVTGETGEKVESSANEGSTTPESGRGNDHPPEVPPKPASAETSGHPPHSARTGFSASIALVMKQILSTGEPPPPPPVPKKSHHGLLSLEPTAADDRPHIKYDWTVGKRLKFSCTVYYAKQFDLLRKRCGIEAAYLKSIEKSANWSAEGGKSRSNFWKTADDRFIIKTLVDAWNVADLQVLIELGPSYFKYMESTSMNPTVLAKLLGFYTIEIRNVESGTVQSKADLLVMENLFFGKKIVKTFDLKGIQGRKVKPKTLGNSSKPLFDGDWIEGQQRALTLLHPNSKLILQEAIKNDSEFLSKSNIMDYSLLLGIDAERKQIACGLVDTIGSYTFAKTLEYKAKQNLKSGKEVTVIPPNEYQVRFVNAMDGYFLACPDKWSKAPHDKRDYSDPNVLQSVL